MYRTDYPDFCGSHRRDRGNGSTSCKDLFPGLFVDGNESAEYHIFSVCPSAWKCPDSVTFERSCIQRCIGLLAAIVHGRYRYLDHHACDGSAYFFGGQCFTEKE